MENIAYNEWMKLYDKDIEQTWYSQHTKLRKAAMVLKVLEKEFNRIRKHLEEEFTFYQEKIQNFEKPEDSTKNYMNEQVTTDKENNAQNDIHRNYVSPEVFFCDDSPLQPMNESTIVDIFNVACTSDEDTIDNGSFSPKINRSRKFKKMKKGNVSNYSILELNQLTPKNTKVTNIDVIDSTIIETTPETSYIPRKIKHKNTDKTCSKGKFKRSLSNSTITQMFSNISSSTKTEDSSTDATYCPQGLETCISPINMRVEKEEVQKLKKPESKREIVFKEPPVRGKARLKLEGWDCAECSKFYRELELCTEDTKKLLNKCSRHRSKFKPHDYTPKGFWDLGFPPTQPPNDKNTNNSTHFQY